MTTILAAVVAGVVVLLAGNVVWAGFGPLAGLAAWNQRAGTAVPWAIVPAAAYLWAYWQVLDGWTGAARDESRRRDLRAHRLSARLWRAALAAGAVGFAALVALLAVAARLVALPDAAPITTPPEMPAATAVSLLAMQSIVAGVSEEAAFRGYMQSPIERRYGPAAAILVNGLLFGLLHFGNHPRDVLLMLPYYLAVSAVYGGLTWAADSILPAVVLHSLGDIVMLTRWWLTGRPEWQLAATPPPLVGVSGVDAPFVAAVLAAGVLLAGTVLGYLALHRARLAGATAPSRAQPL